MSRDLTRKFRIEGAGVVSACNRDEAVRGWSAIVVAKPNDSSDAAHISNR
jgi:hypothetical protein